VVAVTHRVSAPAILSCVVAFAACSDSGTTTGTAIEVTDSAGIEIISNGAVAGPDWTVPAGPAMQIGTVEGDEPYQFTRVRDAVRLPDGRIVVSEGNDYEIRVYSRSGEFIGSFGGKGAGPDEFGGPPWIALAPPDTIVAWDPGHYRVSRFDPSGTLLHQTDLRSAIADMSIDRFVNGHVWQVRADGAVLSTGPGTQSRDPGLNDTWRRYVLIADEGELTYDYGDQLAGQTYIIQRDDGIWTGVTNPFAPYSRVAFGREPYTIATGGLGPWEVSFTDENGALRRIVRADIARLSVSDRMIDDERAGLPDRARAIGLPPGIVESAFNDIPSPDSIPAIGEMHFDRSGNLWVGRRTSNQLVVFDFDVIDPDGRWIATARLPDDLGRILEMGDDYILASWLDDLDVQYLRMYPIVRPAATERETRS
jgi:hypothetical protein